MDPLGSREYPTIQSKMIGGLDSLIITIMRRPKTVLDHAQIMGKNIHVTGPTIDDVKNISN